MVLIFYAQRRRRPTSPRRDRASGCHLTAVEHVAVLLDNAAVRPPTRRRPRLAHGWIRSLRAGDVAQQAVAGSAAQRTYHSIAPDASDHAPHWVHGGTTGPERDASHPRHRHCSLVITRTESRRRTRRGIMLPVLASDDRDVRDDGERDRGDRDDAEREHGLGAVEPAGESDPAALCGACHSLSTNTITSSGRARGRDETGTRRASPAAHRRPTVERWTIGPRYASSSRRDVLAWRRIR